MPLILGTYIEPINSINGFYSSILLKQIDTTHGINNLIMSFGEEHNLNNYKLCKNMPDIGPLCNEIPDYITKLNEFASHFRTTVYIEGNFDLNDVKTKQKPYNKTALFSRQQAAHKMHEDDIRNPREIIDYKDIDGKKIGRGYIEYKSVMLNMLSLYTSCIYRDTKELCKYPNILWQYSDVRKDNPNQNVNASNFDVTDDYNMLINNYKHITKDDISGLQFTTNFEYYILMIDNFDEYIRQVLEVPRIKKQRDKLIPYYHTIFTDESFKQFFLFNRRRIISDDSLDELIPIKNKLIEIIQFSNDENSQTTMHTEFTNREEYLLQNFTIAVNTTIMDIYFILRLYKQSSSTNDNVFVNYFCGDNHVKNVKEYLVNIVKTHECIYEQDNGSTNRYVTFEPDINIPILLQGSEDNAYMPIPAAIDTGLSGGRKKASKKRVSKKRVSKKRRTKRRKYK